jgi:P27 family predicted phage terminase small subunit
MGRPKKPTTLKLVTGTAQPCRMIKNEPEPEIRIPEAPHYLSKYAREEWARMAPLLFEMGLITEHDRSAFAMYCQAWGDHVKAEYMIRKGGHVITTTNGNFIQSPWVGISNKAKLTAHKFLVEFGLTPASRTKVSAIEKEKIKTNPKERFFK